MPSETEFEFDLLFALPDGSVDEEALLDALFEAGCDDGAIGLGNSEMTGVGFTRSGIDAEMVIRETVSDVMSALPEGTRLREVKPDLVSLADVAARLNVSRQAMQKRQMPPPSLGGLYRASEMLAYLEKQPGGEVQETLASARGWFASAPAAQKINAQISLDML